MERSENAQVWFDDTFNCTQAVLASFAGDYGLPEETALHLACAFGGGIGRRQMVCGAVTGALMALGLEFGRGAEDPYSRSEETYAKANLFLEAFTRLNGSVNCRELLEGLDMNDPKDMTVIRERDLFHTSCSRYVRQAVEIAEEIIRAGRSSQ